MVNVLKSKVLICMSVWIQVCKKCFKKKNQTNKLNGYLGGRRRIRDDFLSICLSFSTFSMLVYIIWKKRIIQCKNLHTPQCELLVDEEIWIIHCLLWESTLWLQGSFPRGMEKLVDLVFFFSQTTEKACLLSLPSPLSYLGLESCLQQQKPFIHSSNSIHVCWVPKLHARYHSVGDGSSFILLRNFSLKVDDIIDLHSTFLMTNHSHIY